MKQLAVLFSESQRKNINDISNSTGINKSKVARAAMHLGLKYLREAGDGATDEIAINEIKSLN